MKTVEPIESVRARKAAAKRAHRNTVEQLVGRIFREFADQSKWYRVERSCGPHAGTCVDLVPLNDPTERRTVTPAVLGRMGLQEMRPF